MFLGIIRNIKTKIANAYEVCTKKGATIPTKRDLGNLASTIESIKTTPVLDIANIDSNGTYTPPEGFDGFSEVNVNVPSSSSLDESSLAKLDEMIGE